MPTSVACAQIAAMPICAQALQHPGAYFEGHYQVRRCGELEKQCKKQSNLSSSVACAQIAAIPICAQALQHPTRIQEHIFKVSIKFAAVANLKCDTKNQVVCQVQLLVHRLPLYQSAHQHCSNQHALGRSKSLYSRSVSSSPLWRT